MFSFIMHVDIVSTKMKLWPFYNVTHKQTLYMEGALPICCSMQTPMVSKFCTHLRQGAVRDFYLRYGA